MPINNYFDDDLIFNETAREQQRQRDENARRQREIELYNRRERELLEVGQQNDRANNPESSQPSQPSPDHESNTENGTVVQGNDGTTWTMPVFNIPANFYERTVMSWGEGMSSSPNKITMKKDKNYYIQCKSQKTANDFLSRNPELKKNLIASEARFPENEEGVWELIFTFPEGYELQLHKKDHGCTYVELLHVSLEARINWRKMRMEAIERQRKFFQADHSNEPIIQKTIQDARKASRLYDMCCETCEQALQSLAPNSFKVIEYILMCNRCQEQYTGYCEFCQEMYLISNLKNTTNKSRVCEKCCSEHYLECSSCHLFINKNNKKFGGSIFRETRRVTNAYKKVKNEIFCMECYQNTILEKDLPFVTFKNRYDHDHFPIRNYTEKLVPKLNSLEVGGIIKSPRIFGVELECIYPDPVSFEEFALRTPRPLGIGTDGTIKGYKSGQGGMEIRTPKISGYAGEQFIRSICTYLTDNKFYTNVTCGMHVHFDGAQDFIQDPEGKHAKILFMFYGVFEDVIQSFLHSARRNNRYCRPLSVYSIEKIMTAENLPELEKIWYEVTTEEEVDECKQQRHESRYKGINFHTLLTENHLEVRYHSGTVNPIKVLEWVNLHATIMDKIARDEILFEDLEEVVEMRGIVQKIAHFFKLLDLPESSKKYFMNRYSKFKTEVAEEDMVTVAY